MENQESIFNKDAHRHSLAHIMTQAQQKVVDSNIKLGVGPWIDNGFYHDFVSEYQRNENDLKTLEKEMQNIIKQSQKFIYLEIPGNEALYILQDVLEQPYTAELCQELIDKGEKTVGFYFNTIPSNGAEHKIGNAKDEYKSKYKKITDYFVSKYPNECSDKFITFVNMCKGPHIGNTKEIDPKSFKLAKLAGAYWRGDEKNIMMTRIYAYAFSSKPKLREYLEFLEEAKKRDHRILGKKLDLFCFSKLVGPGLPLFTPRGTIIIDLLQQKIEKICREFGFQKVSTPHLAKIDLFKLSGHSDKYPEELFHVSSEAKQDYVMKPVQCPHQTQIYASQKRSYKDLPIRYMESNKQYRAEQAGEISGLSRVIAITVEDGHSFCRVDQIKDEVMGMVNIIKNFFSDLGLWGNHRVSLSLRDRDSDKYIGEDDDRKMAESMLEDISGEMGLEAVRCEGEAAVYGPKLDFMFKDSLGREIQIPTVQLDFSTPKKFNLTYKNNEGKEVPPVMIHRAILGSYERLLVLLIEHFAGAFPMRLAPEQIRVIPVADKFTDYAKKIQSDLMSKGYRIQVDISDDSFSKKIRNGEIMKIPYLFVVGEQEETNNTINVRDRDTKKQQEMSLKDFLEMI